MATDVERIVDSVSTRDGAGAKIQRSIGSPSLRDLDPFLLLDEFFVEAPAAFPMHPHQGFEIVTYMLQGSFKHKDSGGGEGVVETGGVERITAGRGIRHAEEPASSGLNYGLQLWINLPRDQKAVDPGYQIVPAAGIPESRQNGVTVRTIVGEGSPIELFVPVTYRDITVSAHHSFQTGIPEGHQGFAYILEGEGRFGQGLDTGNSQVLVLSPNASVEATAGEEDLRFALISGQPLNQSVRRFGGSVN